MSKVIFKHGVMDSGKSAELMMKAFLFRSKGKEVLILKPAVDTRSDKGFIESRIGLKEKALEIAPSDDLAGILKGLEVDVVLVDECQFMNPEHVDILVDYVDSKNILCLAYGLKTDFATKVFPASQRFIELSDRVDEAPSMCKCGRKATFNFRKGNSTEQIVVGAEELYQSVCRKCYKELMAKKGSIDE